MKQHHNHLEEGHTRVSNQNAFFGEFGEGKQAQILSTEDKKNTRIKGNVNNRK